jgi:hypothetical protein
LALNFKEKPSLYPDTGGFSLKFNPQNILPKSLIKDGIWYYLARKASNSSPLRCSGVFLVFALEW